MDAIYKKYCKCVYNFLYKLTNDIELSEELTQETFYTAIKKINTLNKKENTFMDSIKKDSKEYLNKKSILDEINKNPDLIDTLSYSRFVQLNSLYEERISELKTKISQLS